MEEVGAECVVPLTPVWKTKDPAVATSRPQSAVEAVAARPPAAAALDSAAQ